MLEKLKIKKKNRVNTLINDLQLIYIVAIKELTKQISVDCSERGQLMEQLWNFYFQLIQNMTNYTNNKFIHMEKELIDEITRIHQMYQSYIAIIKSKLNKLEDYFDENKIKNSKLERDRNLLKTKNHNLNNENVLFKYKNQDLLEEIDDMKKKLFEIQSLFKKSDLEDKININNLLTFEKKEIPKELIKKRKNLIDINETGEFNEEEEIEDLIDKATSLMSHKYYTDDKSIQMKIECINKDTQTYYQKEDKETEVNIKKEMKDKKIQTNFLRVSIHKVTILKLFF